MAARPPLNRVALRATSVADDIGYVALSDLAGLLGDATYRIIGGHMVTALAARWQLGPDLYRETGDIDLGVPPVVVRDARIIERLRELDYQPIAGNRFARDLADLPVRVGDATAPRQAIVDVLVPAYTSRPRENQHVTNSLVTTEVPGLASAIRRDPVMLHLDLHRLNGAHHDIAIAFSDEVAALTLKAHATQVRTKPTDVVDVWRCLEISFAAGVDPREFASGETEDAAHIIRSLFRHRDGDGIAQMTEQQRLSSTAADRRFTRITALIDRVLGDE